ncbi:hypothetical protein AB0N14_17555 [Streptomyces sp. NPDC051104]|uniref:hypothetical protein n=1 Tax=Streptomyces sp. NPDC051104 TaxID=3155044 RepID=UPI00343053F6
MAMELGMVGPAQSEYLYHFTGRNGPRPHWVPEEIQSASPEARLEAILQERKFRAFAPFGAADPGESGMPCLCFSESPPEHLDHLIQWRRFDPWGVVTTRSMINRHGGGAVAYVPPDVHEDFKKADLGHWAVRTEQRSTWLHEREWRLPIRKGGVGIQSLAAILVGNAEWRPEKVPVGWVDRSTGEPLPGPEANPYAEPVLDYPSLWRESPIWVWDKETRKLVKYDAGELC